MLTPKPQPAHSRVGRGRESRRRRLSLRRYLVFSVGVALCALGLALTVSALAVLYAGGRSALGAGPALYYEASLRADPPVGRDDAFTLPATIDVTVHVADLASLEPAAPALHEDAGGEPAWRERLPLSEPTPDAFRMLKAFGISRVPPSSQVAPPPQAAPGESAGPVTKPEAASLGPLPQVKPTATPVPLTATREASPPQTFTDSTPVLRRIHNANVTFYDCFHQGFCGNMANGRRVYEGAAACSYDLPLGTRFYIHGDPTGRIYRCEDRGLLLNTWVDVFWLDPADGWRWQASVGRFGTIDIVEWGQE